MRTDAVLVCRDPHEAHWKLGEDIRKPARLALIGWTQSETSVDAGIPERIAHLLANALTAVARVTFASSEVRVRPPTWHSFGADEVSRPRRVGLRDRIEAAVRPSGPELVLLSTRRPETAVRLFDDAGFPWTLQGQVALLSMADAGPPSVDLRTMSRVLEGGWEGEVDALEATSVAGIFRPGVDGDVAGLLSFSSTFESDFISALRDEANLSGFHFVELTEDAFADRLADVRE